MAGGKELSIIQRRQEWFLKLVILTISGNSSLDNTESFFRLKETLHIYSQYTIVQGILRKKHFLNN